MSTNRRSQRAGWLNYAEAPRGPRGFVLCRQCGVECAGPRRTFCGQACVHAWKLKSDPAYMRRRVFERDRGVCQRCGLDTVEAKNIFESLRWSDDVEPLTEAELAMTKKWRDAWWREAALSGRYTICCRARLIGFDPSRQTWWDADHVLPVVEGGGECDLSNMRTLCQPCHKDATKALARRRARIRKGAQDGRTL